jgi:hypothetical protein
MRIADPAALLGSPKFCGRQNWDLGENDAQHFAQPDRPVRNFAFG